MLGRVGVALVAVVAIAWFGVTLRDDHDLTQGQSPPRGGLPGLVANLKAPAAFNQRINRLRDTRFLNPDTTPDLQMATDYQLRSVGEDHAHALRIAEAVARSEPQNLNAWIVILSIQRFRHDLAGEQTAIAHLRELDPLDLEKPRG